jgi:hypothetical protein
MAVFWFFVLDDLPPPTSFEGCLDNAEIVSFADIDSVLVYILRDLNNLVVGKVDLIEKVNIIVPFRVFGIFDLKGIHFFLYF